MGMLACQQRCFGLPCRARPNCGFSCRKIVVRFPAQLSPVFSRYAGNFPGKRYFRNTEEAKEPDMSKNHYTTKAKRRNRSGKRKDTRRIAANMAKVKELERSADRTK